MSIKSIIVLFLFPLFLNAGSIREGSHGIIVTEMENGILDSINFVVKGSVQDNGSGYPTILVSFPDSVMRKYGVASGMSGSPAYVDGKLIGALSSTWPFLNQPLGNITPIEEMHKLKNTASAGNLTEKSQNIYVSCSIPTFLSFTDSIMKERHLTVKSASASDSSYPVLPGYSVGIGLISGDMTVAIVGTITEKSGNEIYALGHPALGLGQEEFPLVSCKTVTTASSKYMSFKIPVIGKAVGSVINDGYSGIYALLDRRAPTIRTTVSIDKKYYSYNLASSSYLSPLLFQMAVFHATSKSFLQNDKNSFIAHFSIEGNNIHLKSTLFGRRKFAPFNIIAPLSSVLNEMYDNSKRKIDIDNIKIDVTTVDHDIFGKIKTLSIVPKLSRRNGKFTINVTASRFRKCDTTLSIEYFNNRLKPGKYSLVLMGRNTYVKLLENYKIFDRNNIDDMISLLNETPQKPYLYYAILDSRRGGIIGNKYYDEIPADYLQGDNSDISYVKRIISVDSIPIPFVPEGKVITSFIVEEK